ncbi:MAG: ATP-binding cassette domain-containing protein [Candidatus Aenigmarchaeota archaeon]|nr:ATP-binding cassette domain-containing protein [Candidatus Aenigmarchaeota archaeon]
MEYEFLKVKDLRKSYRDLQVLKGVNSSLKKNEQCVLIGPSGGGKSTLLRCVMGLEEIDNGEIVFMGQPYVYRNKKKTIVDKKLQLRVGMVFQQFNLFPHLTVLQNCILGPIKVQKTSAREAVEKATAILDSVGLHDKINEYPNRLSGGQRQRAAIARSLTMEPELMLFDEITSALDPELIKGVLDLLGELASQGMTMLIITHEMDFAMRVGTKVVFLDQGIIMDSGTADLLRNPKKERTKRFLEDFRTREVI